MTSNIFKTASILSLLLVLSSFTSLQSGANLIDGFTYFKTFSITNENAGLGNEHIDQKILLNKNMEYNILLQNNDCDVIIQMRDDTGKLIMTNYVKEKNMCLSSVIFECKATKIYTISLDPKRSKAQGVCKVGFRKI